MIREIAEPENKLRILLSISKLQLSIVEFREWQNQECDQSPNRVREQR